MKKMTVSGGGCPKNRASKNQKMSVYFSHNDVAMCLASVELLSFVGDESNSRKSITLNSGSGLMQNLMHFEEV